MLCIGIDTFLDLHSKPTFGDLAGDSLHYNKG